MNLKDNKKEFIVFCEEKYGLEGNTHQHILDALSIKSVVYFIGPILSFKINNIFKKSKLTKLDDNLFEFKYQNFIPNMFQRSFIGKITNVSSFIFIFSVLMLITAVYLISYSSAGFFMVVIAAILIGYIIVYQCYSERLELRKVPFLERMGKYTYGLYLYHVICNFIIHTFFSKIFNFEDSVLNAVFIKPLLSLFLSIIISVLSYKYIESYFLKLKSRFKPGAI